MLPRVSRSYRWTSLSTAKLAVLAALELLELLELALLVALLLVEASALSLEPELPPPQAASKDGRLITVAATRLRWIKIRRVIADSPLFGLFSVILLPFSYS